MTATQAGIVGCYFCYDGKNGKVDWLFQFKKDVYKTKYTGHLKQA